MKKIIFSLCVLISTNLFAADNAVPKELKGEVKMLPGKEDPTGMSHINNQTAIFISGDAAERLYKDMKVQEEDFYGILAKTPDKRKVSEDNNTFCTKTEKGVVCSLYLNSATGSGYFKSKDIETPCNAVSDNGRNEFKESRSSQKPAGKSSSASGQ